jgi:uncharacterized lipoprotein YehR (DUF1307 family)
MVVDCKKGDLTLIKKYKFVLAALVIAVLLVACGKSEENKPDAEQETGVDLEIKDEEKVPEDDVVAVVNGEDVFGKTYNLVYAQLKMFAGQFGEEVDTDEIKEATIDSLIDRQILMQEASNKGIEVSKETADSEFATLKSENEENLNNLLEQFQMTEETFKEQLQFELTLTEYRDKAITVSVTDEEIEEQYKKAKEGNDDIPELNEIKEELKGNIEEQKRDEALQKKIDEVREKAKIENKLEA